MGGVRRCVPPPIPVGPLGEVELKAAIQRPCSPLVFSKPANIDPFETMFGAVRLAHMGAPWPSHAGAPMWPLCQINLRGAPMRPAALSDLSLLTLFIAAEPGDTPTRVINTQKPDLGDTWALRAYRVLDGLTIPNAPKHGSTLSPRLGEWRPVQPDYPTLHVADEVIAAQADYVQLHEWAKTVQRSKLGGWPGMVQSSPWWHSAGGKDTWDFVMQIEVEPLAGWHGWRNGAAYLARSRQRPHLWAMDVQAG